MAKTRYIDYVIQDLTNANWPGALPYKGVSTRPGAGYSDSQRAFDRIRRVNDHYRARHGVAAGDLRVVCREHRNGAVVGLWTVFL